VTSRPGSSRRLATRFASASVTGAMPMSVHMFCLSSRRATARVYADGRAEFRTDPEWFTDYMRRSTVEWERPLASSRQG
jgi:L(+)-tartrate dehydratase alpha subunit